MSDKNQTENTIENILLETSTGFYDAQDHQYFWAIQEAFNRSKIVPHYLKIVTAKKNHTCRRGCKIEIGHKYFHGNDPFSHTKICLACMAMILYYQLVWLLPAYQYDGWDAEKKQPHVAPNGTLYAHLEKYLNTEDPDQ